MSASGRRHRIALATATTAAALFMVELGLRALGYSAPAFGRRDPQLGWGYQPQAAGRLRDEGDAFVRINHLGYHDVEHAPGPHPGTLRIALLGDSFTAAFEVANERSWGTRLATELAACPQVGGRAVETLNFGVSGYGTAQELLALRRDVWRFEPDLVVLAVCAANDLRDNSKALDAAPGRPYFVRARQGSDSLRLDPSLALAAAPRTSLAERLMTWGAGHSRLVQLARRAKNTVRARARQASQEFATASAGADAAPDLAAEMGTDAFIYAAPRDSAWSEAWWLTERLVQAVKDEVSAHGARLLVVTVTSGVQVDPDPRVRERFLAQLRGPLPDADLFFPERRLSRFGERAGIPVLALAPLLQPYAERSGRPLHGFARSATLGRGHWNEAGHAQAAELVARRVCELLGPP